MSPPVQQHRATALTSAGLPSDAPVLDARPSRLWVVEPKGESQQPEGVSDFVSEDTLPLVPPLPDVVPTGLWVVDESGEVRQLGEGLADFVSEDTLPPRKLKNRQEYSALDTFPDEAALFSTTARPVFSLPAAVSHTPEPARWNRRRFVLLAWTALALIAGVGSIGVPWTLLERSRHPLERTARVTTFRTDVPDIPVAPIPLPAPATRRWITLAPIADPSTLSIATDRRPQASEWIGQPSPHRSATGVSTSPGDASPGGEVVTGLARDPESAADSNVSPAAALTQRPVPETTLYKLVAGMPGIETSSLVPLPAAPLSAAGSGDVRGPSAAVVRETLSQQDQVRAALSRYQWAYAHLDAAAAKEVWPSLDRPALERAFRNLQSQELQFHDCRLSMASTSAVATCMGVMRYMPRIGNSSGKADARAWTFTLRKQSDAWLIESVRVR